MPNAYKYNVHTIDYEDKEVPIPESYGIVNKDGGRALSGGNATSTGMAFSKGMVENDDGTIRDTKTITQYILDSISHEAAHKTDWRENKGLTLGERMALIQEVINRVNSSDRFKSAYVELIKNPDKQVQLRNKATEYYAEITEAYFKGDAKLPTYDKQIVEQVIHKTDPSFKRSDADKFRLAVSKVLAEHDHNTNAYIQP